MLYLLALLPLAAPGDEHAELTVKPLLCIVDERAPACDIEFAISWQVRAADDYCLRADVEDSPLRCWEAASRGETGDARRVTETFDYLLESVEPSEAVAAATVEVLQKDPDDRRRRRRTRHVWDLL